nr:aspartate/glutamate racemase family protein [uncultured Neokomagataea sp.]
MPHLMLYNPNTNATITDNIQKMAQKALPTWHITAQTALLGPHYIATENDLRWATEVTEKTLTPENTEHYDAILIACFGDPAVSTLKKRLSIPIFGMAETSFAVCSRKSTSFSVLTGGETWVPLLETLARDTGYSNKIDNICAIPSSGANAQKNPRRTLKALTDTAHNIAQTYHAPHILLGGTGLAPFYEEFSHCTHLQITCSFLASLEGIREYFES